MKKYILVDVPDDQRNLKNRAKESKLWFGL